MPSKQIFFGNDQRSGDQQLAGASPLAINVLVDGAGAVRRRPGISAWSGFPPDAPEASAVVGIHAFDNKIHFVTEGLRRIYRLDAGPTATNLSVSGADSFLAGTGRPVFALTPWRLVIAGGRTPSKVEPLATTAERLGGSPPDASSVAALASRIVTDDLTDTDTTGHVRFSGVGNDGNEEWDPLNFTSAEARPDPVVAIRENGNELFAFGTTSTQVYQSDPLSIFAPGRAMNYGCAAPHSVISSGDTLYWFSEQREFMQSEGRAAEAMSDPIAATLDAITNVSDCFGLRWNADQFDVLAWVFLSDGRTFAAQKGGGWAQWHGWDDDNGHTLLPIRSHYYWPEQNLHLVGLANGKIAKLDSAAPDDLGAIIKAEVLTGFINRDTDATKVCEVLRLTFKRGLGTAPVEPHVMLSWRDDLGAFKDPIRVGLGFAGDPMFTVELRTLGAYRARQWKVEFTGAVDFVLARAEETFTVGGQN